jgi:hypothetical protein
MMTSADKSDIGSVIRSWERAIQHGNMDGSSPIIQSQCLCSRSWNPFNPWAGRISKYLVDFFLYVAPSEYVFPTSKVLTWYSDLHIFGFYEKLGIFN